MVLPSAVTAVPVRVRKCRANTPAPWPTAGAVGGEQRGIGAVRDRGRGQDVTARPSGSLPTGTVAMTVFVAMSITDIEPDAEFVTKT
jgi:hypothetical protein